MPKTYLFGSGAYPVPMTFNRGTFAALDTSISGTTLPSLPGTPNILTGDAVFDCTSQNLGIVTGTTRFSQCTAPSAPTVSYQYQAITNPTLSGTCTTGALVTLYSGSMALTPSVACDSGTYSITPTLVPGTYSLTARQSNRKGI